MEENQEHENACERYLLGELSEQEQTQLEQAYFADDALFERFCAVKDDLVDAYARGELTGQKREQFERHFLASEPRRERVDEAKDLIRAVTAAATKTVTGDRTKPAHIAKATSWWQSISKPFANRPLVWQGTLAVLVLVALASSWLVIRHFQDQRAGRERVQNEEAARRKQEEERRREVVPPVNSNGPPVTPPASPAPDERTPKPPDKRSLQPVPAQIASLLLTPFSPRAATTSNSLQLGPGTSAVRLRLAFARDDYSRYQVALRTVDGNQVLTRQGLKARSSNEGKSVTLTLDPSIFHHQDYIITLSGLTADGRLEAVSDYFFKVERSVP